MKAANKERNLLLEKIFLSFIIIWTTAWVSEPFDESFFEKVQKYLQDDTFVALTRKLRWSGSRKILDKLRKKSTKGFLANAEPDLLSQ